MSSASYSLPKDAYDHGQVSVGTTATLIRAANPDRLEIAVINDSAGKVYLGKSTSVTTANGFPLRQGQAKGYPGYTGALYGIVASGTSTIAWEEL